MSAYDNDPRVRRDPLVYNDAYWLVTGDLWEFHVVRGDDGIHRAFVLDSPSATGGGRRLGRLLQHIPGGDLDSVIRALIGDPR